MLSITIEHEDRLYNHLRDQAEQALYRGEIAKASKLFDWALNEARKTNDSATYEKAYCNRAAVASLEESPDRFIPGLKEILERSSHPESRALAAYNLIDGYRFQGRYAHARSCAELLLGHAESQNNQQMKSSAAYLLGILWLIEGQTQPARWWLEESLSELSGESQDETMALFASLLGYCLARMNESGPAMYLLEESITTTNASQCPLYLSDVNLVFGSALMELGEFEGAAVQARIALESNPRAEQRKHALYLSGEALACMEYWQPAREAFQSLEREFYPRHHNLADQLLAIRTYGVYSFLT